MPAPALPLTSSEIAVDAARPVVELPGGTFPMGTDCEHGFSADGEGPIRPVTLAPFAIDTYPVTNADFASEPALQAHPTEPLEPCTTKALGLRAIAGRRDKRCVEGRLDAARGGLTQKLYPWGDELTPEGKHQCNIWQGQFPVEDAAEDGFAGSCPVGSFPPNGYGLYSVAGNVWEWCGDWFDTRFASDMDPSGPPTGEAKVMKGGSFLCHASYCNRYRVAARTSNTPDNSSSNIGFRCVVRR